MNKGPGFPGHSNQPGLTSLLPLLSPPELLTERKGRPRFNRLTIGGGGHWRILSEAGHKGFGTGTPLPALLQVSEMKSRLGGANMELKKA